MILVFKSTLLLPLPQNLKTNEVQKARPFRLSNAICGFPTIMHLFDDWQLVCVCFMRCVRELENTKTVLYCNDGFSCNLIFVSLKIMLWKWNAKNRHHTPCGVFSQKCKSLVVCSWSWLPSVMLMTTAEHTDVCSMHCFYSSLPRASRKCLRRRSLIWNQSLIIAYIQHVSSFIWMHRGLFWEQCSAERLTMWGLEGRPKWRPTG